MQRVKYLAIGPHIKIVFSPSGERKHCLNWVLNFFVFYIFK